MAKIVLLVCLFAFVAVQLIEAAPKPDDASVAPVKAVAETVAPVAVVRSDDGNTSVQPAAKADVTEAAASTTEVVAETKA